MTDSKDGVRRDADGDPVFTGISVTNGRLRHDELEEELIQEELEEES